jgi:pyridoxamine 5'-phosphate oxidase
MTDPITRFGQLLERAIKTDLREPTACALATADADGRPAVRMVLLKGHGPDGFVFYTNVESRKAEELAPKPHAALCFYWPPLDAQVRVSGQASRVSDAEADEYFATRPPGSQIGAWASLQSRPLGSHRELEERVVEIERRFAGRPIPRPEFWSGYLLVPEEIEFWQARPNRLHERERYRRDPDSPEGWVLELLYP